tara:strand:- start:3644 stop:4102 length:459 start_codon:yes stop_codon:yes gene_type:complete
MNVENYDFEEMIEQGFSSLFLNSSLTLTASDDIDNEMPQDSILVAVNAGSPMSDGHLSATGQYNHYTGTLEFEIRSLRSSLTQPVNPAFKSRHTEKVASTRKLVEEISALELSTYWDRAVSPIIISPANTQRDVDSQFRYTRLSYSIQFRIT